MGVEWGSRDKMLVEDRKLYLFITIALLITLVIAIYRINTVYQLPSCQEDEYLYQEDYEGPGENYPSDYKCVHVDTIKGDR